MIENKPLYKAHPEHVAQDAEIRSTHEIPPGKGHGASRYTEPCIFTNEQQSKFESTVEAINMLQFLPIAPERLDDIQNQTAGDAALQELGSTICSGWPNDRKSISGLISPYYDIRDELSIQNGVIFKGDRAVIPQALRKDMLKRIYASHLGIEGCLRRARESIYWPQMNAEVKVAPLTAIKEENR